MSANQCPICAAPVSERGETCSGKCAAELGRSRQADENVQRWDNETPEGCY